jgi:hypothetical protein
MAEKDEVKDYKQSRICRRRRDVRKLKIYLETSLFNFYVDESRGIDHKNTVKLFKEIAEGKYEAFTSTYVTDELEKAQGRKRDEMLDLMPKYGIAVLGASKEIERIADIYLAERVIPQRYRTDCT